MSHPVANSVFPSSSEDVSTVPAVSTMPTAPAAGPFKGLFASAQEHAAFTSEFKAAAHARQLSAADMLLHAALTGNDPRLSFGQVTNPVKLANGQQPHQGLRAAAGNLRYRGAGRFGASLSPDTVQAALASVAALLTMMRGAA